MLRQIDEPGAGEGLVGGLISLAAVMPELKGVSLVSIVRRKAGGVLLIHWRTVVGTENVAEATLVVERVASGVN